MLNIAPFLGYTDTIDIVEKYAEAGVECEFVVSGFQLYRKKPHLSSYPALLWRLRFM